MKVLSVPFTQKIGDTEWQCSAKYSKRCVWCFLVHLLPKKEMRIDWLAFRVLDVTILAAIEARVRRPGMWSLPWMQLRMTYLFVGDAGWAKSLQIRPGNVHGSLCVQPCQSVSLNVVYSLHQNLGSEFRRHCGFWFSLWYRALLSFRFTSTKADSSRSDKYLAHQGFKLPDRLHVKLVWLLRVLISPLWIAPFCCLSWERTRWHQCKEALVVYLNEICLGHVLFSFDESDPSSSMGYVCWPSSFRLFDVSSR